jgi:zinc D-Ala-D-Ala carboxypeptidase
MDGCRRGRSRIVAAIGLMLLVGACGTGDRPRLDRAVAASPEARLIAGVGAPSAAPDSDIGALGAQALPPVANPRPLPACTYADVPATHATYDDWSRTLVDTTYRLPRSYVPPDLVPVTWAGIAGSGQIRAIVIDDLRALARAARDAGAPLAVRSAYRSYRRQASVFAGWVAASGRLEALRFSARPGHSEHQLGTALDVQAVGGPVPWQVDFAHRRQGLWLARNAWRYGFVISYPSRSEAVTCYGAEAWHMRYVGREIARAIHRSGLALREWLWLHDD